jgi:hypothetical protein
VRTPGHTPTRKNCLRIFDMSHSKKVVQAVSTTLHTTNKYGAFLGWATFIGVLTNVHYVKSKERMTMERMKQGRETDSQNLIWSCCWLTTLSETVLWRPMRLVEEHHDPHKHASSFLFSTTAVVHHGNGNMRAHLLEIISSWRMVVVAVEGCRPFLMQEAD